MPTHRFASSLFAVGGLSLLLWPSGCGSEGGTTGTTGGATGGGGAAPSCELSHMFGLPNDTTGLDESQCAPSCECGSSAWTPEPWTDARIAALKAWTLLDPPAELTADPYAVAPPDAPAGQVCGFVAVDASARTYRVTTFDSEAAAGQAGAIVTHHDACGLCSTLEDLAVYAAIPDLTAPVRQCGIDTFGDGLEADVTCLEALGFTRPCAEIWAYNTQHTRAECLSSCTALLDAPYHEPDGTLNACLLCDEQKSGPVFKAVAGRTRRNTGVASALCRPCDEVARLDHAYP
jgi:hypothetical protein